MKDRMAINNNAIHPIVINKIEQSAGPIGIREILSIKGIVQRCIVENNIDDQSMDFF